MDLVANAGNTTCRLAAFSGQRIVARAAVRGGRSPSEMEAEWDAFSRSLPEKIARAAVASVNPAVLAPLSKWMGEKLALSPSILGETLRPKIAIEVDAPERVGADRIANALWAARNLPGRAAIVVDLGTAISFSVVSSRGAFVGGAIAPGLGLGTRALAEGTALLPRASVSRAPRAIGRTTAACIESGVFWGAVGLVERVTKMMEDELGEKATVLATGGDAELVASATRRIERVVPDMTLEGIHLALEEAT
ncbi:type III pantothenate kinase [bacterium]|nr:type III pantothenate kinase [bacterium]